MPEELPRISLYLRFYGTPFDPSQVTERLELQPTGAYRMGEPIQPAAGLPSVEDAAHHQDGWFLKLGPRDTQQIDEMLADFEERVGPAAAKVQSLCDELDIEAVVLVGIVQPISGSSPNLKFPQGFLRWVAE